MSRMRGGFQARDPITKNRRSVLPDAPRRPGRRRGVRGLIATPAALRPPPAGAGGSRRIPRCRRRLALTAAAVLLLVGSATGEAMAASCAGVENRVNARTEELQGTVSATDHGRAGQAGGPRRVGAAGAQLRAGGSEPAGKPYDRAELDVASEGAGSGDRCDGVATPASGAEGADGPLHGDRLRTLLARHGIAGSGFAHRGRAGVRWHDPGRRAQPAWRWAVGILAEAWFRDFREGPPPTPDDLLSGDRDKAARWADFVMGPPDLPEGGSGAGTAALAVARAETDARRTAALEVLKAVAPPSPLQDVARHWSGTDGGIAWSATMAAGDERSSKLDSIAIKAARAAIKARSLRIRLTLLMATAADAAARIDAEVSRSDSRGGNSRAAQRRPQGRPLGPGNGARGPGASGGRHGWRRCGVVRTADHLAACRDVLDRRGRRRHHSDRPDTDPASRLRHPEITRPRCPAELARGREARKRLEALIEGAGRAELVGNGARDRRGRPLVRLILDGRNVGETLMADGLALAWRPRP